MIGLAQPVEGIATQSYGSCPDPLDRLPTIGLVVSSSHPDLDAVRRRIEDLDEPGVIWVCAETDREARRMLDDPILLPLLPHFKTDDLDVRRQWRDCELLSLCERVYVFQKTGAKSQWNEWAERHKRYGNYPGLHLEEMGAAPKRKRAKGRKPVGV